MEHCVVAVNNSDETAFFDTAPALLFIHGGGEREQVDVSFLLPMDRVDLVEQQQTHVVVCDGISTTCRQQLAGRGVRVVCVNHGAGAGAGDAAGLAPPPTAAPTPAIPGRFGRGWRHGRSRTGWQGGFLHHN
jgi:hypothetical protein